jgi:hypothetical protein
MEAPIVNEQVAIASQPTTIMKTSYIAASTWTEIGLTVLCLLVVLLAVMRGASKTVFFLFAGLVFLVLKISVFWAVYWVQPQSDSFGALGGWLGGFGWAFIFLYCMCLLMTRPAKRA